MSNKERSGIIKDSNNAILIDENQTNEKEKDRVVDMEVVTEEALLEGSGENRLGGGIRELMRQ